MLNEQAIPIIGILAAIASTVSFLASETGKNAYLNFSIAQSARLLGSRQLTADQNEAVTTALAAFGESAWRRIPVQNALETILIVVMVAFALRTFLPAGPTGSAKGVAIRILAHAELVVAAGVAFQMGLNFASGRYVESSSLALLVPGDPQTTFIGRLLQSFNVFHLRQEMIGCLEGQILDLPSGKGHRRLIRRIRRLRQNNLVA